MAKSQVRFVCRDCGGVSAKWLGRCPDCEGWNTFDEEVVSRAPSGAKRDRPAVFTPPRPITEVVVGEHHRHETGIGEFDRVLGGGIVPGSVVLIGGDPGIGKSTILTQAANNLSREGKVTLYISGEESPEQIKMRADRLGVAGRSLHLASETNMEQVEACISSLKPGAVIIDSIQTMYDPGMESAPATVGQVRACTGALVRIAKGSGIPIFIVGHVNKEGAIAGPRVMEHMVDTVLYFEGDRHHAYRILRAVKNRFGSTDELGIFEMHEDGLREVSNPSEILLSERAVQGAGSVVTATMEGSRPILIEIQALVAQSHFTAPRRMATGIDFNRAMMILAVLEKRVGLPLANKDVYINVAGGVKVVEPAVDLAVLTAVASSLTDVPVNPSLIVLGEVGLAGEVRGVTQVGKRIREAARLGFEKVILSAHNNDKSVKNVGIAVEGVSTAFTAVNTVLGEIKKKRGRKGDSGEDKRSEGE